jgi:hypothetical protein
MVLKEEQQPQTGEKDVGEKAPVAESPPPLPQEETPPADILPDEAGETLLAAAEQSDFSLSQQPDDSQEVAETSEPATAAEPVFVDESVSVEDKVESKPPDDEQDFESNPESGKLTQDAEGDSEIALTEAVGLESIPDADTEPAAEVKQDFQEPEGETIPAVDNVIFMARDQVQAESATDEIQSSPEPEVIDLAGDEPGESETLGENIVELVEIEASQQESEAQSTPETFLSPEKPVEAAKTNPMEELQPKNEADITNDAEARLISESLGDTILLEAADEVQPSAGESPDKIEETAKLEFPAEALKIEKAAQDMAAAIEKQKAKLAEAQKIKTQKAALIKAQALKMQKVALAKARDLKKQKMILAKAAALKRKKAAQANAQALQKQEAAQAGIETTKKDEIAATKTAPAAGKPKVVRSLEANSKMQNLLGKYKGQAIGINYDNSAEIREAQLVEANAEFFSVFVKDKRLQYSHPLKTILTVIEGKDGVDAGDSEKRGKFNVVIKVYPLVLF